MQLEPDDVPNIIMDLHFFGENYPNWKIPMRYLNILTRFLSNQLSGHPAVTDDVLSAPAFVAPFKPRTIIAPNSVAKKSTKKRKEADKEL